MTCPRQLETQAYHDGEMDGASAAAVERHIENCADCTALAADIGTIRDGLRKLPYHAAEQNLRSRIERMLDRENGRSPRFSRSYWKGAASGFGVTALAASLALFLMLPRPQDEIAHDVVTAHLRSLLENHLVDVASSDHHTVRPWFDGRTDIAPPAEDYAKQGFHLMGGRLDYVDGRRAAVLVYRHGAHVVNVFAWKNDGAATPGLRHQNGYALLAWQKGDLFYCAVSDAAPAELKILAQAMQRAG
jgi:anti-sigma factor RsiW